MLIIICIICIPTIIYIYVSIVYIYTHGTAAVMVSSQLILTTAVLTLAIFAGMIHAQEK